MTVSACVLSVAICRAAPKSSSIGKPLSWMSTLSGAMSRWKMFELCSVLTASRSGNIIAVTHSCVAMAGLSRMTIVSDLPSHRGIAMYAVLFCCHTRYT